MSLIEVLFTVSVLVNVFFFILLFLAGIGKSNEGSDLIDLDILSKCLEAKNEELKELRSRVKFLEACDGSN